MLATGTRWATGLAKYEAPNPVKSHTIEIINIDVDVSWLGLSECTVRVFYVTTVCDWQLKEAILLYVHELVLDMEADELVNSSALQMLLLRVVLWSCELQSNEIRKVSRRRRESLQLLVNKTSLRTDVIVYSTYLSYTLSCLFIFLIAYLIN